jgi:UDP-N-acetylmuramate dehydrogenase
MRIEYNVDLTPMNSYGLRASAATVLFPETEDDYQTLCDHVGGDEWIILGSGNNVILSRENYTTPFVVLRDNATFHRVHGTQIFAGAGVPLKALAELALERGLTGFETFYDIPGTLGGAIFMNAGAYDESILDLVSDVYFFDAASGELRRLTHDRLGAGYRTSCFQHTRGCILSATLDLAHGSYDAISRKMAEIASLRRSRLPQEYPNAGSVFRRPAQGLTVGEMMERAGMKGHRVGDAEISTKHGGFIVNRGAATAGDVLRLVELMQATAVREFGMQLELEQRII